MALPIPINQLKERVTQEGLILPDDFDVLVAESQRNNQSIVDLLVSRGVASEEYLFHFIASFLGVEMARLSSRGIDEGVLNLLSEDIARSRQTILFAKEPDGTIDAAMADPSDLEAMEYLSQRLKAKVRPFLATRDDLTRGFAVYGLARTTNFKKIIEENIQESLRSQTKTEEEAAAEVPIVAAVDTILSYAISLRASDVHIEALEEYTLVRYRVDGILHEILHIPRAVHAAIIARIKLLGGLKIDEHNEPQDGRFRHEAGNQVIDVRVSILPTAFGEKIAIRLLEATQKPLSLEELGMLSDTAKMVERNLKKTYGMILSCGPTGSGKTTTLYGILSILNKPEVNISTIEDPIEYNIRYVNQSQINPRAGITFVSGLRSLLRQDPNIIMVGEIRDKETANIAVQAALTGHLLLSSLHTNDAPTAVPRLFDLGIPPFLVSSTLTLVISQRLVRRICTACIESYEPGEEIKMLIQEQLQESRVPNEDHTIPKILYRGKGCAVCGDKGYRGRLGIFEMLEMNEEVREFIVSKQFGLDALRTIMRKEGIPTMFEDGIKKAELGLTSIEEVMRVIRE